MNENIVKRNELLAAKVIKGLESRNMSGYYAENKEEALKIALGLIPEGSSIGMGGAMSVHEIGLSDALKNGNYNFIDRDASDDKRGVMLATYDADFFLSRSAISRSIKATMSTLSITTSRIAVNISLFVILDTSFFCKNCCLFVFYVIIIT